MDTARSSAIAKLDGIASPPAAPGGVKSNGKGLRRALDLPNTTKGLSCTTAAEHGSDNERRELAENLSLPIHSTRNGQHPSMETKQNTISTHVCDGLVCPDPLL